MNIGGILLALQGAISRGFSGAFLCLAYILHIKFSILQI